MPRIDAGGYLIAAFHEVGRVGHGFSGPIPLSWLEIQAFSEATGDIGSAFEKRMLRDMSLAYLDGLERGKDSLAKPFY